MAAQLARTFHAAAERAIGVALAHAADGTHSATERAAQRTAKAAARAAAQDLCLQDRGAAEQREHRDRLDQVFAVHVIAPELLIACRGTSAAVRRYYAREGGFLPGSSKDVI
jgi:hypothetical protein